MADSRVWNICWRLSFWSWLLLLVVVPAIHLCCWKTLVPNDRISILDVIKLGLLGLAFASMFVLGTVALAWRKIRVRLFSLPVAAATSVYTGSLLIAMLLFVTAALTGIFNPFPERFSSFHPAHLFTDIGMLIVHQVGFLFIGMAAGDMLPLLGLVLLFPSVIPPLCSFTVHLLVRRRARINSKIWLSALALATVAWCVVLTIGTILALGG